MAVPARLLVDAGPLIALFNRRDRWHREACTFFGDFRGTLVTTWPVLAEAGHFIGRKLPDLLDLVEAGRIQIVETAGAVGRIAALLRTYADLPMDLADATLVAAAELLGLTVRAYARPPLPRLPRAWPGTVQRLVIEPRERLISRQPRRSASPAVLGAQA